MASWWSRTAPARRISPRCRPISAQGRDDRFVFYRVRPALSGRLRSARRCRLSRARRLLEPVARRRRRRRSATAAISTRTGELVLRHACRLGLEGVVSKLRDAPYRSGRGKSWVKSKCSARQEFVVAGYRALDRVAQRDRLAGARRLRRRRALRHVGRVGTGFTPRSRATSTRASSRCASPSSPFARRLTADEARQVRFVRPELVAEVEFRAWTADGHPAPCFVPRRCATTSRPARSCGRLRPADPPKPRRAERDRTHPSRPALLAGRRRHQARARRLLRRGLAAHGAVRGRPAARAGALPRRGYRARSSSRSTPGRA